MTLPLRHSGRTAGQMRPVRIVRDFLPHAEGSALIEAGNTRVLCTATVEEHVPPFLRGKNQGWITAEYGMLPRSTGTRMKREAAAGKQSGRTVEIQRLIGRSLRAAVDLAKLGERQIILDCDVLCADGGTRCAAITGAWVALAQALEKCTVSGSLNENPLTRQIAAVSVGIVDGVPLLDLDYPEDSRCGSDINLVLADDGKIIEIQGTAEGAAFARAELSELLALGENGIRTLFAAQKAALRAA